MPALGAILLAACGCGGEGSGPMSPERGERQKQARIEAYGKAGIANATNRSAPSPAPALSGQAAARQKSQGNR